MKIRSDFVSNSSSSSFIVDSNKHGKWYNQLISIMQEIREGMISEYQITFDNSFNIYQILSKLFERYEEFEYSGRRFENMFLSIFVRNNCNYPNFPENFCGFCGNVIDVLKVLDNKMIDHIINVRCSFHDECDIGMYADQIYKKLEETGFEFEWDR